MAWRGVALALGSATGIAVHVLGWRSFFRRVHPLQPIALGFLFGAVLFAPLALWHGVSFSQTAGVWSMLLYLGLVPSALAYLLYLRGLQDVPATMASIVTMIEPLVAGLLAWFLFDERLGALGLAGGALLLASIGLLSAGALRGPAQVRPAASSVDP